MKKIAEAVLPSSEILPKRPWISQCTLRIISRRNDARAQHDEKTEKKLTQEIKRNVKADREAWLQERIRLKDWNILRSLKKPMQHPQGLLKNMQDEFVGSDGRAETLAEYFEKVQWRIRHDAIASNANALYEELEMDEGAIKTAEVEEAINHLKKKKSTWIG